MSFDRKITFTVKENQYSVSIPNNQQLIDIETTKALLAKGTYRNLMSIQTGNSVVALDTIDMISYLTVLCPALIKDSHVDSLTELDVLDSKELLNVYRDDIAPWIVAWQKVLSSPKEETTDDKTDEPESTEV